MDKYNAKTSFQKWFSSINLEKLSEEDKERLRIFDSYSKKLDFQTTLKILLYAVYEELPSYREINRAFFNPLLCKELSIDSLAHSSISRRSTAIDSCVLMELFSQLVQKR